MPLAQFVRMMSDMSAVPITIDPAVFDMTGASPSREVAVDATDATLESLLHDVLGKQRMDFVERDGQLVVVCPNGDARRPREYDVADLLNPDEADATRLAALIEQFVDRESWQANGGAGTIAVNARSLHIEQADSVHLGILVFCERLRLARGLPLKSRYPAERLTVAPAYSQLARALEQPTTFTFVAWSNLADVVRDWQKRSGVTMLVDWRALAELELSPTTPISCSVIQRTWRESLDEILPALGLAWWAIDGETISITSRAAAERTRRIEFYAISKDLHEQFAGDAALIDALRQEVRQRAAGEPGKPAGGDFELAVDRDHLIVLGNAFVHRYLTGRLASGL